MVGQRNHLNPPKLPNRTWPFGLVNKFFCWKFVIRDRSMNLRRCCHSHRHCEVCTWTAKTKSGPPKRPRGKEFCGCQFGPSLGSFERNLNWNLLETNAFEIFPMGVWWIFPSTNQWLIEGVSLVDCQDVIYADPTRSSRMEPNLDHAAIHEFIFEWLVDKLPASDLRITPRDPIIFYSCSNTVLRLLSKFFSCFSHFLRLVPRLSMSLAGRLSMFQVMGPTSEATLWSLAHRPGFWLIRSISTKFPPNSSSLQFQWSVEAFPCHLPKSTKVLRSNPRPGGEAAGYSSCGTKSCSRRPKVQMFCQEEVEPGPWLAEHIVYFFSEDFRSAALDGSNQRYIMLYQFVSHFCLNLWLVFISCFSPFCWWNMVKASNFLWRLNGHLVAMERAWHHHGNWWSRQRHLKAEFTGGWWSLEYVLIYPLVI